MHFFALDCDDFSSPFQDGFGDFTLFNENANPLSPASPSPGQNEPTQGQQPSPPVDSRPPPKPRKHSRPRGSGPDSRSDPNDHYHYEDHFHFKEIQAIAGHPVRNTVVFEVVKCLEQTLPQRVVTERMAKRRHSVAYHWLDVYQPLISKPLLAWAISVAEEKVTIKATKR
jgi:hypothetical protein